MNAKPKKRCKKSKFRTVATSDTEDCCLKDQIQTLLDEKAKLFRVLEDRNVDVAMGREKIAEQATIIATCQAVAAELNANKTKLFETLNQNVQLKNDLKLAQKCIHQEIGENVSIAALIAAGSSWRGRAQQIKTLQTKMTELHQQPFRDGTPTNCPAVVTGESSLRKVELEKVEQQLSTTKDELDEMRRKCLALKVRNHNLKDEVAALKTKCGVLQENKDLDEKLKTTLNVSICAFNYGAIY